MTVKSILDLKGRDVFTIGPEASVADAAHLLSSHRIGALVVTRESGRIAGILSERDVVRALGQKGAAALDEPVANVMTAKVSVCGESHTVADVMEIMTRGRFRHLPVEEEGILVGLVSIGDVVKRKIEEVERETEEIKAYIATA